MVSRKIVDGLTTKDALLYNPYDNNRRLNCLKDFNFSDIRIISSSFLDEKNNLSRAIDPSSNFFQQFYILSGYSGNGKTTFLYWFKEEIEKENYWFDITNLIEEGHGLHDDFKLVNRSIIHKYKKKLLKKNTLEFIWENRIVFRTFYNNEIIGQVANLIEADTYDIETSLDLIEILDCQQLLILFVLDSIFDFISDPKYKETKSFIFCFDNLDELKFEYITPKMWRAILDLSSNMTNIIQNTNIDFEYTKRIVFLLVFREANIACGIAQLNDRLSPNVSFKRFIYTTTAKEIISKRLELVQHLTDDSDVRLQNIIKIILSEKILETIILPLFNYDYRKLSESLIDCIKPENIVNKEYRLFYLHKTEYDNIYPEYLKRGILINTFIRYFAKENYLEKLAPIRINTNKKIGHCNISRLMLTVFSNLSFPQGFPSDKRELAEIKPLPFSFLTAFNECKIFTPTPLGFFNSLEKLINLDKSSWAHLVTIYGKQPTRNQNTCYFDFSFECDLLKRMLEGNELTEEEDKYINSLSISLNASAYIYLRHILTHFEYISGYKTKNNGYDLYYYKPLALLTDITVINKIPCWEFEAQIESVFKVVELYTHNNFIYFNEKFKSSTVVDPKIDFCQSNYVFKGNYPAVKNEDDAILPKNIFSFYSTRLITTHINYLECFREYITDEGYILLESKMNKGDKVIPKLKIEVIYIDSY